MQYPRPLSVDSVGFDPSGTPLQRFNKVDHRDLTHPCCHFFEGCPWDSDRTSVSMLFRSLGILSIALQRVGWECPARDRKLLFQDSQMLLALDPLCIVVTWTFHSSGENSSVIFCIPIGGMTPSHPAGWWMRWYVLFQNNYWNSVGYVQDVVFRVMSGGGFQNCRGLCHGFEFKMGVNLIIRPEY